MGIREGYGRQIWSDGAYYMGYFKNNSFNGKGIFVNSKGQKFDGTFVNDRFSRN